MADFGSVNYAAKGWQRRQTVLLRSRCWGHPQTLRYDSGSTRMPGSGREIYVNSISKNSGVRNHKHCENGMMAADRAEAI